MEPTENPGTEKLRRVRIEGFRSIQEAEIKFGNATILIGANGAGKSNLIGFLQMLSYMMRENLSLFVNERRGANSLLHFGSERTARISGEFEIQDAAGAFTYGFGLMFVAGDKLVFWREALKLDNQIDPPFGGPFSGGEFESALPGDSRREYPPPSLGNLPRKFLDALPSIRIYHFHNTSETSAIRGFQALREDISLLSQGGNLAVMLRLIRQRFGAHYRRIVEEMRQVLPGFLDFVLEPDATRNGAQIELRWTSKFSKTILGPDQLSDGSIRAAALLTLLLQPEELKPGVIVIDEPELGLHPYAVGQIARLINEASVHRQIIVSTQSPRLLSEFEPEQVVVVESKDGRSEFRHLSSEDLSSWLEQYDDLGMLFEMNVTGGAPL